MISIWIPKKTKFKKLHKGTVNAINYKPTSTRILFGLYGIKLLKSGRLKTKQLEAARRIISRFIRKKEKVWIRSLTNIQVTAKPNEIRMGKGKGSVEEWVLRASAGKILFELSHMPRAKAFNIFNAVAKRLPLPIALITLNPIKCYLNYKVHNV